MKRPLLICLLSTASITAVATAALADPPARVGRIAYTEGEVSFQPPETSEWTSATRNFPVAPGEAFWTADDGRAEVIDLWGKVIPGLHCGGETSGGFNQHGLAKSLTFGRIAGREAAKPLVHS